MEGKLDSTFSFMFLLHFLLSTVCVVASSYGGGNSTAPLISQTSTESVSTTVQQHHTTSHYDTHQPAVIGVGGIPVSGLTSVSPATTADGQGYSMASAGTPSTASSATTNQDFGDAQLPEQPALTDDHQIMGSSGPNQQESAGIAKALDWLKEKREHDFGWGNDTHMVILAKELSGGRDPTDSDNHVQMIADLEELLSVKQMEIEILTMLNHHNSLPMPVNADKLARYVLALGSLCKDPKRFHTHDLVANLLRHEPAQDQEFALVTLAACSSAAHVRKRQIRRLLDIASGGTDQSVDTVAMVLLALRCIVTDHRHRHLQHFVRRPARGLASLQGPRGSFGSLRSTALAMQALQDLEPDPAGKWSRSAASKWILERQRSDGGWTEEPLQDGQDPNVGVGLTADIILALGWKGLGAVRILQCDHVIREMNGNGENGENGESKIATLLGVPGTSVEESEVKNVSYTYTLWVGSNVTDTFSLSLVSSKNTSFFRAMTQAAELDSRFAFEAREWPNGHYVHTLAGLKEEPRGYNYWLLYRLPELPDPANPPGNQLIAPVGVDELIVEEGEHYLYWYKKL
ncbi:uncharacterized protein CG3556 [Phlebotomus argentipes]|uniref:uncharacterized protein CG3556 n=1 Tax=Phlebotomus argentipes TaxID=94469 RepID=UPI002892E435|nr:uncharacterized protein CG3556 [Phlebotomus argentipes]